MKSFLITIFASLFSFVLATSCSGHALEPGYLEIIPIENEQWQVTWRKPQVSGKAMEIDAVLPKNCAPRRAPSSRFDGRAYVSGWIASCTENIWDNEIFIEGLNSTATDVLVRFIAGPRDCYKS